MAHPHVERAAEPERKAALGLVELHRGNADIHHDAIDRIHALRGADFGQIGESVLDQSEPAARPVDQIEPAGDSGAVAVDADHPGPRHLEDRPAVAAGAEGRIDKNTAVARREPLDRLAAQYGDMAPIGRGHAATTSARRGRKGNLDADRPMASQFSALCRAFRTEKPPPTAAAASRPRPQTLFVRRNWLGCHGISSVKKGHGLPKTGSALHHLVTALSLKKALTMRRGFCALLNGRRARSDQVMRPARTRSKCEPPVDSRIATATS